MTSNYILLQAAQQGNFFTSWGLIIILFVVFYFFMIRPQQKRQKEIRKFRESLTKGDNVVTAGGIHGKIVDVNDNDNYFLLEIASGVRIRIDKGSVYPSAAEASQAAEQSDKKVICRNKHGAVRFDIKRRMAVLSRAARTQRGKNILTFGVFLAISAILWVVLSLNEEDQVDMHMRLKIEHVPDSVIIVSTPPEFVNVSMRARRTDLLKSTLTHSPELRVDWRAYRSRGVLALSSSELKTLARSTVAGATVLSANPDSLNLLYTSSRGRRRPVVLDYKVTPGPQVTLMGRPVFSPDSVTIYSVGSAGSGLNAIATEPIRLSGLNATTTVRVRLVTPPRTRAIPDSVDVTFRVEPLIVKTRRVVIEPVNVPAGIKLITFPAQVNVSYMLPASIYKHSSPQFRVVADYRQIDRSAPTHNMRLRLVDVDENLQNVYLSTDSAEYIIEK